ncbi:hypothetical protein N7466_003835 [Penicillium verhagenii]|uniref:uncharacterized protein n=1 Tax=Penicillium verhagenii TaxID=1562060 RepID=UPI0025453594|nr:uncharacterized protein N7466_003835 [Penicillium verhagenii]KAJ5934288.1 hypothetical protein N7466_003835 [Penicillium verhagenii]
MFKASPTMMARLRFTTKSVNGGYYKGTRTGSMGHFDKKGNYVIDYQKVRTYVVPEDLNEFDLTPFVSKKVQPKRDQYVKQITRNGRTVTVVDSLKGQDYINIWGDKNAEEVVAREAAEEQSKEDPSRPSQ